MRPSVRPARRGHIASGRETHRITDSTGLISTGPLSPGQSAALPGPAAATYHLRTTTGPATATFAMPPTSSTTGHATTVRVATQPAPAGYPYNLEIKTPVQWAPAGNPRSPPSCHSDDWRDSSGGSSAP